jgi:AraC-like DNA-binding protein
MDDFFKYLTPGEEDKQWGIYLNVAGKVIIPPGRSDYPSHDHPSDYYFTWEKGRILNEFQINYITRGSGIYETEASRTPVRTGSLLITRPGIWHRYRPLQATGWTENYVGFDGSIPRNIYDGNQSYAKKPVLQIGNREEMIDTYHKIFDLVQEEKPGFQQVASGMVMKLLGYMVSLEKQRNFTGKRVERIIRDACFEMRENIAGEIDFKIYAEKNNIGYSYFRKMFKQYTGIAPVQYYLDLRIRRAREMLISTDQSIKEIAYEVGFHSIHYFSRTFKKKSGVSPSEIRKIK